MNLVPLPDHLPSIPASPTLLYYETVKDVSCFFFKDGVTISGRSQNSRESRVN